MGDAHIGVFTSSSCFCFVGLVFFDLDSFFIAPALLLCSWIYFWVVVTVVWI